MEDEVIIYQTTTDETGMITRTPVTINLVAERQRFLADNKDLIIRHTDEYIEGVAKSMGYSSADSASAYAGAKNRFQLQSTQFIIFRGACWDFLYDSLDAMLAGNMDIPAGVEVFLSMLPKFEDFEEAAKIDITCRYGH